MLSSSSGDVTVQFTTLMLQGSDQIIVYDGPSTSSSRLAVLTQYSPSGRLLTGSSSTLYVLFQADYSGDGAAFTGVVSSSTCWDRMALGRCGGGRTVLLPLCALCCLHRSTRKDTPVWWSLFLVYSRRAAIGVEGLLPLLQYTHSHRCLGFVPLAIVCGWQPQTTTITIAVTTTTKRALWSV